MEEERPNTFKALRAKFQEEALLAQSKASRPPVAEKPKHLWVSSGGHCSSVISSINISVENMAPALNRVVFRDGLRPPVGRRPTSFPPLIQETSPTSSQLTNGDGTTTRKSLKDRRMPLVLPVLPVREQQAKKGYKLQPEHEKEVPPHTKIKKKGLLLPFKSSKASKASTGELTHADLPTRPSSAPGELPSVDKQSSEDGGSSFQSDQSAPELALSSPDLPTTPPASEISFEADNKRVSTLERAKKKFSCRQMVLSSKPKRLGSPEFVSRDKAFPTSPKSIQSVEPELPVPPMAGLLHIACISARPFFKASNSAHKSALDKMFGRDQAKIPSVRTCESPPRSSTLKTSVLDLRSLGPSPPPKPPRPPFVDLRCYHPSTVKEVSPVLRQAPGNEPEPEPSFIPKPLLDIPEFPDFGIGALEMESLPLVSIDLPPPDDCGFTDFEGRQRESSACDPAGPPVSPIVQDLNLGNENIIPLDPACFPEPINLSEFPELAAPEHWSYGEEVCVDLLPSSKADKADPGAAESQSAPQGTDNRNHADLPDKVQHNSSVNHQDSYYEAGNNLYEDVESTNRLFVGQHSLKHRAGLKNPYADHQPLKEEAGPHKWQRNPWASISGERAPSAQNHFRSKEHRSPNTADYKEQRKREKQHLDKVKKEQKERDKKENEMKKKFKVTGEEEPMYHAKVTMASKLRKNDLPVKSGDTVSIIRTTSCPKGKWLARNTDNKYGYISVMNVELNIKEMLELGKKAQAAGRGGNTDGDTISNGSRTSNQPVLTSSFTDDSEEWTVDGGDETLSPSNESHSFPRQSASMLEMSCANAGVPHSLSDANLEHAALQKLAVFFQQNEFGNPECDGVTHTNAESPVVTTYVTLTDNGEVKRGILAHRFRDATVTSLEGCHTDFLCAVEEPPYPEQVVDFTELEFLPPPLLYADT